MGDVVPALAVVVAFFGLVFEARLFTPRWDEVARATCGGRPSPALLALYAGDRPPRRRFVGLTPEADAQPVQHWYHDGGDIEPVAPSLAAFLAQARSNGDR